jgi:hypothetical protein
MAEIIQLKTLEEYNEDTKDLSISQFKREKYLAKLSGFNAQLEEIEGVMQELLSERDINNSVGAQLDVVGSIVNESRRGRIDPEYRAAIKQRISLRFSGTPEDIIEIVLALYGGTYVDYVPTFPGKFHITTDATVTSSDLIDITPAGVGGYVITDCLVDALGNFIVDANGDSICTVLEIEAVYITDAQNNPLVDANGNNIIIFEQT